MDLYNTRGAILVIVFADMAICRVSFDDEHCGY